MVLADKGHSQYQVKLDGSGRVTLRNRSFLKRIVPFKAADEVPRGAGSQELDRGVYQGQPREVEPSVEPGVEPAEEPLDMGVVPEVEEVVDGGGSADAQHSLRRSNRAVLRPAKYSA